MQIAQLRKLRNLRNLRNLRTILRNAHLWYRTMFQSTETSMTWRITTQPGTELPRHVFVAFQSSERDNNQQLNNMIFDNANLRRISCRINSIQYPEREFECNFTPQNRNYSRLLVYT